MRPSYTIWQNRFATKSNVRLLLHKMCDLNRTVRFSLSFFVYEFAQCGRDFGTCDFKKKKQRQEVEIIPSDSNDTFYVTVALEVCWFDVLTNLIYTWSYMKTYYRLTSKKTLLRRPIQADNENKDNTDRKQMEK